MWKKILQGIVICFAVIVSYTAFAEGYETWPVSERTSLHRLGAEETGETAWSAETEGVYGYTLLDNGCLFTSDRLRGSMITFSNGDSERTVRFEDAIRYDFEQDVPDSGFSSFDGGAGILPDGKDGAYMTANVENPAALSLSSLPSGGCYTIEFDAMKSLSEPSALLAVKDSEGAQKALAEMRRRGSSAFYLRSSDGDNGTVTDNSSLININDWFHVCVIIDLDQGIFRVTLNDGELFTESGLQSPENKNAPSELVFELNIDNLCIYRGEAVNTDEISFSIGGEDYAAAPEEGFRYTAEAAGVLNLGDISGRIIASGDLRMEADGAFIDDSGTLYYKSSKSPVRVSGMLNLGGSRYSAEKEISVIGSGEAVMAERTVIDKPVLNSGSVVSGRSPVEYTVTGNNPTEEDYQLTAVLCIYSGSRCVEIDVRQVCLQAGSYENSFSFSYEPKSGGEALTACVYVINAFGCGI